MRTEIDVRYVPGGPACELTSSRIHRLQTVDYGLYEDLRAADEGSARRFCRELTHRAVFCGDEELSPTAQAVARLLVEQRPPKDDEWQTVEREYDSSRLLLGAMRPGLSDLEDPEQTERYRKLFIECRRLEVIVCQRAVAYDPADVVYAAIVAGVAVTADLVAALRM